MKPTYLFYDIETTGLNKCFDQVLQFAAIRTDRNLQEIERHEIRVRLNPDIIPAPKALITHRISMQDCLSGLSEYEAIQQIHALLNTPGTISLGYNTLAFDDEFLRFSFFRNLFPPYTHQFANQCARMDLYPMTVLCYLYKPDALQWPTVNGKISFKLEHLNTHNQLVKGAAHNAMVDVEATLALARCIHKQQSFWNYVIGFFDKTVDRDRFNQLTSNFAAAGMNFREALLTNAKAGSEKNYQAQVLSIGQHNVYKNDTLWLSLDSKELQQTNLDNVDKNTFIYRKKLGDEFILLPTQERFMKRLSQERLELAKANKAWLLANTTIFQKICEYHQNYIYPKVPNLDIDAALYEWGFPSSYEESLFREFAQAKLEKKREIIQRIPNVQRQLQAYRILGRCSLELLDQPGKDYFTKYIADIYNNENSEPLRDYRGKEKLTPHQALKEIAELKTQAVQDLNLDLQQQGLLDDLEGFIQKSKISLAHSS